MKNEPRAIGWHLDLRTLVTRELGQRVGAELSVLRKYQRNKQRQV